VTLAIASRPPIRLSTLAVLLTNLAGCTAPTQYQGPIVVEPVGLADRFRQLCARRVAASQDRACSTEQLGD